MQSDNLRNQESTKKPDRESESVAISLARSEFIAKLSHEMRTPLNAIVGMSDVLSGMELPPDALKYAGLCKKASENLLDLVSDLLDVASLALGKVKVTKQRFDLYELVESVCGMFSIRANEKEIKFQLQISPAVTQMVVGDATKVRQILTNLLSNAIQFTDHGQVCLMVEAIESSAKKMKVQFVVSDTGPGIDKIKQQQIFAKFYSENSEKMGSGKDTISGTGLGLAICKSLVDAMDGKIWVNSRVQVGTQFFVEIPLELEDFPDQLPIRPLVNDLSSCSTLLIVSSDSEGVLIEDTIHLLRGPVVVVNDLWDGLDLILSRKSRNVGFDLVIVATNREDLMSSSICRKIGDIDPKASIINVTSSKVWDGNAFPDGVTPLHRPLMRVNVITALAKATNKLLSIGAMEEEFGVKPEPIKAKILLAEDSEDNRNVISAYLRDQEIELTMARNGQVAVELWEKAKFDLVLMDLRMPVLDGYNAVIKIREIEKRRGQSPTPIVAITAHAFASDRELCLANGFDDYLAKPVKQKKLLEIISHYILRSMKKAVASEIPPELVESFRKNKLQALLEAKAAIDLEDWEKVARFGHTLKGDSAPFGFADLEKIGIEIEKAAESKSPNADLITKLMDQVKRALER